MNSNPHTHELKIVPRTTVSGAFRVEYGDQTGWVARGPFKDFRIRRKIRKTIARHDRKSVEAGRRDLQHQRYVELARAHEETFEPEKWASQS